MTIERELTAKEKQELVQKVLDVYQADPARLRKLLPEIADFLEEFIPSPAGRLLEENPSGLIDRERNFHREELDKLLKKFRSLTTEDAIKGLEHGAVLLDDNRNRYVPMRRERDELLKLVRKATGIRPRKTGKPAEKVVGEGEVSREVPVVRGLLLHLTWEFKLVKVTMDPKEWLFRCKAMAIVGIGRDKDGATDVSIRHHDYVAEIYEAELHGNA